MDELIHFIMEHEQPFMSANRLASLYSDFSNLKTSNPDGYRANVDAWTSAFTHASRAGVVSSSSTMVIPAGDILAGELQLKGLGRPAALDEVFNDAVNRKTMIPTHEFLESNNNIYDKKWIQFQIPSPVQIARWGLRHIGLVGSGSDLTGKNFVIIANVEAASRYVLGQLMNTTTKSSTSLVHSLETFTAAMCDPTYTLDSRKKAHFRLCPADIPILLRYMTRDKNLAVVATDPVTGTTTIKFSAPNSKLPPAPITQHDTTIATLHTITLNLNKQVNALQMRIEALATNARTAVGLNQRTTALTHLRAKKALEFTLEKRVASLEQVQSVLNAIDEATGQVEMVRALEAGGKVLKELNERIGGVERVESIVEGLREEMDNVEDVGKIIGDGSMVDEEEVDEEMEKLEKEVDEKNTREENEKIKEMPSAPVGPVMERNEVIRKEREVEKRLSAMSLDEPRQQPEEDREQAEKQREVVMNT